MENDYGISKFAPLLAQNCPKKVTEVVRFLEDEMGVPDQYKLEDITVEDLTGNGLLKRGPAMQLVKGWQSSKHLIFSITEEIACVQNERVKQCAFILVWVFHFKFTCKLYYF